MGGIKINTQIKSTTTNYTTHVSANGEEIFPCRCGHTHRGEYGFYDYMHHNCFHSAPLIAIAKDEVPGYYMCPECGKTFWLEDQ